MSQCDERTDTFPSLRWTIGDGLTSGFREKDVSRNEVVVSSVLSCVIAVGPSFVHQYKLLTVAKNGPGSALSQNVENYLVL